MKGSLDEKKTTANRQQHLQKRQITKNAMKPNSFDYAQKIEP